MAWCPTQSYDQFMISTPSSVCSFCRVAYLTTFLMIRYGRVMNHESDINLQSTGDWQWKTHMYADDYRSGHVRVHPPQQLF